MASLDTLLGTMMIGYSFNFHVATLHYFRTWESSSLFTLELVWAVRYYKHYSNEDSIYLKIIIPVAIIIDFVGLIGKCANIYLVCSRFSELGLGITRLLFGSIARPTGVNTFMAFYK